MTASVFLLQAAAAIEKAYTYAVPENMKDKIIPGSFVTVPFGMKDGVRDAVVWDVTGDDIAETDSGYKLKEISEVLHDLTPLTADEMELSKKMRDMYLCTIGDSVRCFIPPKGNKGRTCNFTVITFPLEETEAVIEKGNFRNISQIKVLEYLRDEGGRAQSAEIINNIGCTASVLSTLEKHGYVRTEKSRVKSVEFRKMTGHTDYPAQNLTEAQRQAYKSCETALDSKAFGELLLHGVTGSGKTEIYLQLINKVLSEGGSAIVLVPEISLTPQMSARFEGRFGDKIAIIHSRLKDSERANEWDRIKKGEARVVLGARSAVFAPVRNLRLIVLDEEHELTYKSDEQQPRYNAGEVAALRCRQSGGVLLRGSATPSIETFYHAKNGEITYVPLTERINKKALPQVEIVDMRQALDDGERGIFSNRLIAELRRNLEAGEQSVIYVHRRGFSGHVICGGCGKSLKCGKCNISMTYHSKSGRLICHYCGNTVPMPQNCPVCGNRDFKRHSFGTQKVQEELWEIFPEAKIVRMDADTTFGREGHAKVLEDFTVGGGDILVGTQMIAKGHDFPNVTLAAVLSADSIINGQDWRASEKSFQLITQVAGRAGRGEKPGRVIIQAFDVDNYALRAACAQDYDVFFNSEIKLRRQLFYPPFCTMAVVGIIGTDDRKTFDYGVKCRKLLSEAAAGILPEKRPEVMGLTRAAVPKLNDKYRWRIIIKAPDRDALTKLLGTFKQPKSGNYITGFVKDISPGSMF